MMKPCITLLVGQAAALKQTKAVSDEVTHSQFASSHVYQHWNLREEYPPHRNSHSGINPLNLNASSIKAFPSHPGGLGSWLAPQ